jgi:hypothetical protein
MKASLITRYGLTALLLTGVVYTLPLPAQAQNTTPQARVHPSENSIGKPIDRYNLEIANGQLLLDKLTNRIDLTAYFGKGPISAVPANLGNIVAVLRELHTNANLVMEPSLAELGIGDLKIRSVHTNSDVQLREELLAFKVASGNKFRWEQPADRNVIDPLTGQPTPTSSSSLYVLSVDPTAAASKARRQVEVFNIADYIQEGNKDQLDNKLETLKAIIEETAQRIRPENDNGRDASTFEFHRGANLLIVVGSPESIDAARKVVNALLKTETRTSPAPGGVPSAGFNPYMMDPRMMERYGLKFPQPTGSPKTQGQDLSGNEAGSTSNGTSTKH